MHHIKWSFWLISKITLFITCLALFKTRLTTCCLWERNNGSLSTQIELQSCRINEIWRTPITFTSSKTVQLRIISLFDPQNSLLEQSIALSIIQWKEKTSGWTCDRWSPKSELKRRLSIAGLAPNLLSSCPDGYHVLNPCNCRSVGKTAAASKNQCFSYADLPAY